MSLWLKASLQRAIPFIIYLAGYAILGIYWQLQDKTTTDVGFITFLVIGGSIGAFLAAWRLAMAFAPDARFADTHAGYFDIPASMQARPFSDQLLEHAAQLRRVALSYEKHRQNLTRIGLTIGVASLVVPIATWTVILLDAFRKEQSMPNAWLLVVSSTTTGALGLAISVTLLRHLKNNQKPLAEVFQRLMLCIETNMAITSSDGPAELRAATLASALESFIRPPSIAVSLIQEREPDGEGDKRLATSLLGLMKPNSE